jgi:hypothetical protein
MASLPPNPTDTDPISLAARATRRASKAASGGAKLAQGATDTTLGTTQRTTGTLQKSAGALPGPLGPALGALPLDETLGTVRGVTTTAFSTVRGTLFALRAWLVSLWALRWIRLVVQWTPTVIASVWIGAQLIGRVMRPRHRGRR